MDDDKKYQLKAKHPKTGKYWSYGSVKKGKFGWQAGMKNSAALHELLQSVAQDGYVNFNIYEDDRPGKAPEDLGDPLGF